MRVGVVVIEVISHRLDHRPRNLRAARAVEVRDGMMVMMAFERREVRANFKCRCDAHLMI